MKTDLPSLAAQIILAQTTNAQLSAFSKTGIALTMQEAYQVSSLVHEARLQSGWKPIGRKIGFTNRAMWALYGVTQPVWSFVYDKTVQELNVLHHFSLHGLVQPKIEPEIVFCMRATPPLGASEQAVLDCVEWVAHGIEMVQCHYPDWKFTSTDAVCDASFHGNLFIGRRRMVLRDDPNIKEQLKTCKVNLYKNESLIEVGCGGNVLDSPLLAVSSLIDTIHREGSLYPILPGEIITTGTMTTAHTVHAGEQWRTDFDQNEFPGLSIDFT